MPQQSKTALGLGVLGLLALSTPALAQGETATCRGRTATIVVGDGGGLVRGTDGPDVIVTGAGDDHVVAGAGRDLVCTGAGDDVVHGGAGRDAIEGGPGFDRLFGDAGRDGLLGGAGPDRLFGGGGDDRLLGGDGRDEVWGGPGDDRLSGGGAGDWIVGGGGRDVAFGGAGADLLEDEVFDAGEMHGNDGDDLIRVVLPRPRSHEITDDMLLSGGHGDDRLLGLGHLSGGSGFDVCVSTPLFGDPVLVGCEAVDLTFTMG